MNTKLLLSWLGLPPGPWPPDDRTLLGLPQGSTDSFAAEKRALELMDRLRPHQLVHPDLVTEGMNRLAQALVALSTGGGSPPPAPPPAPAPTRKVQKPPPAPKPAPAPPKPAASPSAPVYEPVDFALPNPPAPVEAEVVSPQTLDAEVIEAEVVEAEVVEAVPVPPVARRQPPPTYQLADRGKVEPPPTLPPLPPPPLPDFAPPSPPGLAITAENRRNAYKELAGLRKLRRAWRRLRASVADPAEQLLGPAEVCGFLEAVLEVREALARPELDGDVLGQAGASVRTVVKNPLALAVFRSLIPVQRQALARDWAMGLTAIEMRYGAVRGYLLKDAFGRRKTRRRVQTVQRWLGRNPEWVPAALTILGLLIAALRYSRG